MKTREDTTYLHLVSICLDDLKIVSQVQFKQKNQRMVLFSESDLFNLFAGTAEVHPVSVEVPLDGQCRHM